MIATLWTSADVRDCVMDVQVGAKERKRWCSENFVSERALRKAADIRAQLQAQLPDTAAANTLGPTHLLLRPGRCSTQCAACCLLIPALQLVHTSSNACQVAGGSTSITRGASSSARDLSSRVRQRALAHHMIHYTAGDFCSRPARANGMCYAE